MKYTVSLKENRVFRRLYAKGKSAVGPAMVLYCRKNGGKENRLGFTVGTKLGCAVVRNRVRRRLREIYRLNEEKLRPGYDIVVVARVRASTAGMTIWSGSFSPWQTSWGSASRRDPSHESDPALDDPVLPEIYLSPLSPLLPLQSHLLGLRPGGH